MQTCLSTNGFARRRPRANPLLRHWRPRYDKAFSAIFDANATTLITAIILFWQATGSVKGFAVTLTLGIIASMFSALLVTRTAFRWAIEKFGLKKLSMLDLIPKKKFDFLGKRWIAAILSHCDDRRVYHSLRDPRRKEFRYRLQRRRPARGGFQTTRYGF